jgi:hypothetical protein
MQKLKESDDYEALKFLMECSFKEAGLFWQRNTVFASLNIASFGAAFALFRSSNETIDISNRLLVCFFGVFLCIIWALTIRSGRTMNHAWVASAKSVVKRLEHSELKTAILDTPADSAVGHSNILPATKLMYVLAFGCSIVWILVSMIGPGGLI